MPDTTRATPGTGALARTAPVQVLLLLLLLLLLLAGAGSSQAARYDFDDPHLLTNASNYAPWASLIQRHRSDRSNYLACMADADQCPRHLLGYRRILQRAPQLAPEQQLQLVNRFVNRRPWQLERRRVRDDVWRTPMEFYAAGGDCEDFAIAKYFLLRDLGFATRDLRVVVVWDRETRGHHAVLAVHLDGQALLLETDDSIRRSWGQRSYRFLFALNEDSVWDHEQPTPQQLTGVRRSS